MFCYLQIVFLTQKKKKILIKHIKRTFTGWCHRYKHWHFRMNFTYTQKNETTFFEAKNTAMLHTSSNDSHINQTNFTYTRCFGGGAKMLVHTTYNFLADCTQFFRFFIFFFERSNWGRAGSKYTQLPNNKNGSINGTKNFLGFFFLLLTY